VNVCAPGALRLAANRTGGPHVELDYGRCIACNLCVEACPAGALTASHHCALTASHHWEMASLRREDLLWGKAVRSEAGRRLQRQITRQFGRSLHIRHVDAGSCNGCESELQALNNPFYNLHRLGIFFTASPRFADLLLITGVVTSRMREAVLATYRAMPEPRWVMAAGACAISGGTMTAADRPDAGASTVVPVDVFVPGCPPSPAAVIAGLLLLLGRAGHQSGGGPSGG
jgi:formate hydrogenlyase subunit 7